MTTPPEPPRPLGTAQSVAVADVERGWIPTRKWIAAQVVALGALAASAIESGWSDAEWKILAAIVVQALTTYLLGNDLTPGGVPDARPRVVDLSKENGQAGPTTIIVWCLAVLCVLVVLYVLVGLLR